MRWSELAGRRVLILGTGREGRALADALLPVAGRVSVADEREGESAAAWRESYGARVPLVDVASAVAEGVEIAIASPGIPPHSALRRAIAAAGIEETSLTDLWLGEHACRTTAVTGSKGKSTTSALIHALSRAHGVDAALGGNIGIPLLTLPTAERYVAEVSSQQAASVTQSPDVVVFTALFPEHLDWHGSEQAYYRDKLGLAAHGARRVIVNGDDARLTAELARLYPELEATVVSASAVPAAVAEASPLLGRHNLSNLALALAAVAAAEVAVEEATVIAALREFRPLEHRLEATTDASGLTFIDDSLSTSPYAAIAAIEALGRDDLVLLVGGLDRGVDYAPLADFLRAHPIAGLVGLPDSGARILAEIADTAIPAVVVPDMDAAVSEARRLAPAGGVVLLSPAAPSYGRYRDFADRAADFRRAVAATAPPSNGENQ